MKAERQRERDKKEEHIENKHNNKYQSNDDWSEALKIRNPNEGQLPKAIEHFLVFSSANRGRNLECLV